MIESYLGFDALQQIVIGALIVGGTATWIWGVTVAIVGGRKNKLFKDCPHCEGTGTITKQTAGDKGVE